MKLLKKLYSVTVFALGMKIIKGICVNYPQIISPEALHMLSTKEGREKLNEMIEERKKELL